MSERPEDLDVTALESALRELRPAADPLDRAVLMYRAGQASARGWIWPVTTLFPTALAFVLGITLWMRPVPSTVYVFVPSALSDEVPDASPSLPPANDLENGAWSRYVHLQEQVLLHGLDGLPPSPIAKEQPLPAESLWNPL